MPCWAQRQVVDYGDRHKKREDDMSFGEDLEERPPNTQHKGRGSKATSSLDKISSSLKTAHIAYNQTKHTALLSQVQRSSLELHGNDGPTLTSKPVIFEMTGTGRLLGAPAYGAQKQLWNAPTVPASTCVANIFGWRL